MPGLQSNLNRRDHQYFLYGKLDGLAGIDPDQKPRRKLRNERSWRAYIVGWMAGAIRNSATPDPVRRLRPAS